MTLPPTTLRPFRVGETSISAARMAELRHLVETAARTESRALAALVRRDVAFTFVELLPRAVPSDGSSVYAVSDDHGVAIARFLCDGPAVLVLADLMMGGFGIAEARPPSPLETQISCTRIASLATALIEIVQGESSPVTVSPAAEDVALVGDQITIELTLTAAEQTHRIAFVAPVRRPVSASDDMDLVARTCAEVPIDLRVQFRPISMHATDVASLAVGDVLCLDHEAHEPVLATVDGRALMHAHIGRSRRFVAIEVDEVLASPAPRPRIDEAPAAAGATPDHHHVDGQPTHQDPDA